MAGIQACLTADRAAAPREAPRLENTKGQVHWPLRFRDTFGDLLDKMFLYDDRDGINFFCHKGRLPTTPGSYAI